ncbi:hypothetical protein EW026_g4824 [Hermanssonia centrifuga]|uniref:ENTH domain-containing protein n=1 Tax=Hermanssonia centrifuga TaxID=98765 RepID=A0A4S4KHR9_9APHY|nr:hypothetical protein EW026_g4824 [Hermanssonia centrifuga]
MQHFGKGIVRVAKNYTKGYSDVQAKVRDATSNDPWGPSGTQMNELAQMTYNQNDFVEIMEMLDKRLNDKGKNWRHVFKSLTVLDYLLHAGSENVVIYFKDNIYVIKTLKEFQYLDEEGKDQGANVRQKAKDISNLLTDEARLRQERRSRAHMRDRMVGGSRGGEGEEEEEVENENTRRRSRSLPARRPARAGDDDELKRAIEESKRSLAEEQAKKGTLTAEERDLQQAIKLSEEEERKRNEAIDKSNQNALFDDQNQLIPVATSASNPFPLVDTGSQPQYGLQPQFTQMQPQYTSFNPYQQQAQQEAMQQLDYQRQQQEWMRQQQELQAQQQAQLQAQQQAQFQAQQQEEWMRQQQYLQQQQLQAQQPLLSQPTGFGTNNPFAPMSQTQSPIPSFGQAPTGIPQPSSPVSFNLAGTYGNGLGPSMSPPPQSVSAPPISTQRQASKADQDHANLANIFANREDGIDSFGNYGQLRFGQQASRLAGQQTGQPSHNPFALQQQQQQQYQNGNDQPFFSV